MTLFLSLITEMYGKLIQWLNDHQQVCWFKQATGIDCPGCGMQRALVELLKGNIIESIRLYPALLPLIFMISFLFFHLFLKIKSGAFILKISFIFTSSIIVISFFYKIIIKII